MPGAFIADENGERPQPMLEIGDRLQQVDEVGQSLLNRHLEAVPLPQHIEADLNNSVSIENSSLFSEGQNSRIQLKDFELNQEECIYQKQKSNSEYEFDEGAQFLLRHSFRLVPQSIAIHQPLLGLGHIKKNLNISQVTILINFKLWPSYQDEIFSYAIEGMKNVLQKQQTQIVQYSFQLANLKGCLFLAQDQVIVIKAYLLEQIFLAQVIFNLQMYQIPNFLKIFESKPKNEVYEEIYYFDPNMLSKILERSNIHSICIQIRSKMSNNLLTYNKQLLSYNLESYEVDLDLQEQNLDAKQSCIGCNDTFIIEKIIADGSPNEIPIITFPSIKRFKTIKTQLCQKICGLLNSGGGIILFGVILLEQLIIGNGEQLNFPDQLKMKAKINKLVSSSIYPTSNLKKEVVVTFMLPNSMQNFSNLRCRFSEIVMARIRVCPRNGETTYFVRQPQPQNKQKICCYSYKEKENQKLNSRQTLKLVKYKHKNFSVSLNNQQVKHLFVSSIDVFVHNCKQPEESDQHQEQIYREFLQQYQYLLQ